jgi:hypothetical protein
MRLSLPFKRPAFIPYLRGNYPKDPHLMTSATNEKHALRIALLVDGENINANFAGKMIT